MSGGAVVGEGLGVAGPNGPLLHEVSLTAQAGRMLAVTGSSGSGKTAGTAIDYDRDVVVGTGVSGEQMPARVVPRVHALPLLGDEGQMADLGSSLVEFEPPTGAVVIVELWVAKGTPPAMLAKVRAAGVDLYPLGTVAGTLHDLRNDAFSLGLRLLLIVGLATLLLAILGVFASAILQSRWRSYEVASLRVVGVSQRSLLRGSVLEYAVMLGFPVLLGLGSAYLSLRLVLPSVSLGTADPHEPVPLYPTHWSILGVTGLVLFALAVLIALVVSRRITRLGRPSTLRWAELG
jgi:putative ABC transport system permease protein